jgi:hypothetical protein
MALRAICIGALVAAGLAGGAVAHPGGLNKDGCHNNRKTGDYHCHRGSGPPPQSVRPQTRGFIGGGEVYYPNCAAARAAGAAPVRRGDPGYGRHLDRDGDGKGCE